MNNVENSSRKSSELSTPKGMWRIRILGRDRACVAQCPEDERRALERQCTANLFSAAFVGVGCAAGLSVGGFETIYAIVIGIVFSAGILLFDTAYGERASNDAAHNLAMGKKAGVKSGISNIFSAIPRSSIALATALFVSTFAMQLPFGADVDARSALVEEELNRPIVDRYQEIVNGEESVRIEAAAREAEIESQKDAAIAQLREKIRSANDDFEYWQVVSLCELHGANPGKGCPDNVSALIGPGVNYNYAVERRDEQAKLIAKYELELSEFDTATNTSARVALERWRETKSDRALTMAQSDPDYVASPDSLLYRIEGLWQLVQSHKVLLVVVLALDIVLIAFDTMGMQVAGWRRGSPGQYEYMKASEILERESLLRKQRAITRLRESKLLDRIETYEHAISLRRFARDQWHNNWRASAGGPDEPPTTPMH